VIDLTKHGVESQENSDTHEEQPLPRGMIPVFD